MKKKTTNHKKNKKNTTNHNNHKKLVSYPNQFKLHLPTNKYKKPLLIAAIAIGAILILSILLFFGQQFAGRAYYTGAGYENTAGIVPVQPVNVSEPFTVTVEANIGTATTVALAFNLTYPSGLTCSQVESLLDWDSPGIVFNTSSCTNGLVMFKYATLDWTKAETGLIEIANITFSGDTAGEYNLKLDDFTIISFQNHSPITLTTLYSTTVNVTSPTTAQCTDADSDTYCLETTNLPSGKTGGDCNDNNALVWKNITAYPDSDKDTYGDASASPTVFCTNGTLVSGYVSNSKDCDDTNSKVSPLGTETCDGIDNNCNGNTDETDDCPSGQTCSLGTCVNATTTTTTTTGKSVNQSCTSTSDCKTGLTWFISLCTNLTGKIIIAEDISKSKTKITAVSSITTPFWIFTTLKNSNGTVLVFNQEKVSSMSKYQVYNSTISYSYPANIAKKSVVIYDNPNPSLWKVYLDQAFNVNYTK